jgi:hypothetical protein
MTIPLALFPRREMACDHHRPAAQYKSWNGEAGARPSRSAANRPAPAHPLRGLRFRVPNRPTHLSTKRGVDRRHSEVTDLWIGVGCEGRSPLCPVLLIGPAGLMGGDIGLRTLLEGHPARRIYALLPTLGLALLDRVAPFQQGAVAVARAITSVGVRTGRVPCGARARRADSGIFRTWCPLGNLEHQAPAVGVASALGLRLDGARRQPVMWRVPLPPDLTRNLPEQSRCGFREAVEKSKVFGINRNSPEWRRRTPSPPANV